MNKCYAMYDWWVSSNNPSWGFSNTKRAIVFDSKEKRDAFLEEQGTFDYSCEPITRKEAMGMLEQFECGFNCKGLRLNSKEYDKCIIFRQSEYDKNNHESVPYVANCYC